MNCIKVPKGRVQWRMLVNTAMSLPFLKRKEIIHQLYDFPLYKTVSPV